MRRFVTILLLTGALFALIVVVLHDSSGNESMPARRQPIVIPPARLPDQVQCVEPSEQQKTALRVAVRTHGRELRDGPWALVNDGDTSYLAAAIDAPEIRVPLAVVVRFTKDSVSSMRAVNGTARTFTDLPEAGSRMPRAATRALDCVRP